MTLYRGRVTRRAGKQLREGQEWKPSGVGGTAGRTLEGWPGVQSPGYFVSGVNPRQRGNVVHVARPPAAHESSAAAAAGAREGETTLRESLGQDQTDKVLATVATSPERDEAKINGKEKCGYES